MPLMACRTAPGRCSCLLSDASALRGLVLHFTVPFAAVDARGLLMECKRWREVCTLSRATELAFPAGCKPRDWVQLVSEEP
eukprot:scaffold2357_cov399-Prasinococcus_capsulatus_cf.AAC.15